jgi:hypothetical protein
MSGGTSGNDSIDGTPADDTINGEAGDDTINAGDGDDSIDGGSGRDSIDGGDGNDSLEGGEGNDTLTAGSDNDTVSGGDGHDYVWAGSGDDSVDGGAGDDSILGDDGLDTIEAGSGSDTVRAGNQNDVVHGNDGNDELWGESGSDTIYGGNDDDTIYGGSGNDVLRGGAGNDHIRGDSGNNTIEGGEGDDSLYSGTGNDTFVIRDGHGNDTITWFDTGNDIIAFDMAEISGFQDVVDRMETVGNDTVITFDNGDVLQIKDIQSSLLSASNFAYSAGPVCLHEGTLICTERGEVAIENLRPDDIVWTKDHGWQAIRLVTFARMVFKHRDDPAKPVLIPAGALGAGVPHHDLITSPQNRVLQITESTGEEVLVPAIKLTGKNGIRRMRGRKKAHYLNIVMERHSIIQASGCWVESLLVTARSLERQGRDTRRILGQCTTMKPARRIVQKGVRRRRLRSA